LVEVLALPRCEGKILIKSVLNAAVFVKIQTRLRTTHITPNDNKSFSIDTMLMVDDWSERLGFNDVIGRHKSKGIDLDALVRGMLA
jgi:hypothetical protein